MGGPKILLYDTETSPSLVYVWNQYQTNVIDTKEDWYLLSFAYKWLGEDKIFFERKAKKRNDDRELTKKLWRLLDQADVIVGHNSDSFDNRKATARFIYHNLGPPSPYQSIDTKKVIAQVSSNYSNALNEIARLLDFGRKVKHHGFDLWLGCMSGDPHSWKIMEKYNRHDIELLEKLYFILQPWVDSVNMTHWSVGASCKHCGGNNLMRRGLKYTNASVFQTLYCKDCGGYSREKKRNAEASMR